MPAFNQLQRFGNPSRQAGFSLMEGTLGMTISLVVTAAMVAMMANSLGNTSRIVNMTKLSDDLRTTMQLMTRDVRRTSYNANALLCYGNDNCFTDGSVTLPGDIDISDDNSCFTFELDRDHDGDSTENAVGGFRRIEDGGIGVIQMWIGGDNDTPDCDDDSDLWVEITNPDSMDIAAFSVDDDLSYTETIFDDGAGNTISQKVRKLRLNVEGQLVTDDDVRREIEDIISVRNDLLLGS